MRARPRSVNFWPRTSFLAIPKHHRIDLQLEELTTNDIVAGVRDGHAAIGVCWADADMSGLEWVPDKGGGASRASAGRAVASGICRDIAV